MEPSQPGFPPLGSELIMVQIADLMIGATQAKAA
jgi:hypothetical protein